MNREVLGDLAEQAAQLAIRTQHLTDIGKPVHSLALELAAERQRDPLRALLEKERAQ